MMEFKGTPGPWLRDGLTVYATNERGTNQFSAHVEKYIGLSDEEAEANARLIATAPELLEVAQLAYAYMKGYDPSPTYADRYEMGVALQHSAHAAIAKALGYD